MISMYQQKYSMYLQNIWILLNYEANNENQENETDIEKMKLIVNVLN